MMKTVLEMNKFTFLSVHSVMGETDVQREVQMIPKYGWKS